MEQKAAEETEATVSSQYTQNFRVAVKAHAELLDRTPSRPSEWRDVLPVRVV
jgi:hypothetical protein